jgi:ABC-type lipoprotein export system ATPase subunit
VTLVLTGLSIAIGSRTILAPTDLELPAGATLAVVGPSGAGKTTVLGAVAGLASPAAGTVLLDGADVRAVSRERIGVVTEPVLLADTLTVAENIAAPLQIARWARPDIEARGRELLRTLHLEGLADREPTRLSGGQRQRVAVARAVAGRPPLIVADEPTSELDHDNRERAMRLLLDAARGGSVVVLATHDEDVAAACDRLIRLDGARRRGVGDTGVSAAGRS